MRLLRCYDRQAVCNDCHYKIAHGKLLRIHSQLPLPAKRYSYARGVFVTKEYLSNEPICKYFGKLITDKHVMKKADSDYVVSLFYGTPPLSKRKWIDGDRKNCDGRFRTFFCLMFEFFFQLTANVLVLLWIFLLIMTVIFILLILYFYFLFIIFLFTSLLHQQSCGRDIWSQLPIRFGQGDNRGGSKTNHTPWARTVYPIHPR